MSSARQEQSSPVSDFFDLNLGIFLGHRGCYITDNLSIGYWWGGGEWEWGGSGSGVGGGVGVGGYSMWRRSVD